MTDLAIAKKPGSHDWHSAYIVYQLRLKGLSLRRLARLNGYAVSSGTTVTYRPFPKIERLIADAIGVEPKTIWPSRYNADGTPKRGRHGKGNTAPAARNVHARAAR